MSKQDLLTAAVIPKHVTIGDKYDPIFRIRTAEEANNYLEKCVQHAMLWGHDRAKAEQQERDNIGYYAAYGTHLDRDRIEGLFNCEHPFFGAIAKNGPPTPEQALQLGINQGRRTITTGEEAVGS